MTDIGELLVEILVDAQIVFDVGERVPFVFDPLACRFQVRLGVGSVLGTRFSPEVYLFILSEFITGRAQFR